MIKSPGLDAKLLVSREASLESVIAAMTDAGQRIILVCDRYRVLEGVVTDYDIRVSILNHVDMATPASEFMNRTPVTVMSSLGEHDIFDVMERTGCQVIPVLDPVNRVIGLRRMEEFAHFVDCVANDRQPLETGEDGRAVLEIILAAYESAGTGRKVALPFKAAPKQPIDLWKKG